MATFITTAVRTSNPTQLNCVHLLKYLNSAKSQLLANTEGKEGTTLKQKV
jgi:hypothetical protein